ncbi:MAG TPA: hypothetical protein VL595_04935 [Pseudonocardia sp.]|jgi:hypothetical protein|nr:hypothetical protein [Pseudonocardia sp.]
MSGIERPDHPADEPVTVNYRYVGRIADDLDRWIIEFPAGTTIENGSILRIDQTATDVTPPGGENLSRRTFRMYDAGAL